MKPVNAVLRQVSRAAPDGEGRLAVVAQPREYGAHCMCFVTKTTPGRIPNSIWEALRPVSGSPLFHKSSDGRRADFPMSCPAERAIAQLTTLISAIKGPRGRSYTFNPLIYVFVVKHITPRDVTVTAQEVSGPQNLQLTIAPGHMTTAMIEEYANRLRRDDICQRVETDVAHLQINAEVTWADDTPRLTQLGRLAALMVPPRFVL